MLSIKFTLVGNFINRDTGSVYGGWKNRKKLKIFFFVYNIEIENVVLLFGLLLCELQIVYGFI